MSGSAFEQVRLPDHVWEQNAAVLAARDVGAMFRLARRYAGASQNRLAAATGISQSRISTLMNSSTRVTNIDVLNRIADGLNLPDSARLSLGLAPRDQPTGLDDDHVRLVVASDEAGSQNRAGASAPDQSSTPTNRKRPVVNTNSDETPARDAALVPAALDAFDEMVEDDVYRRDLVTRLPFLVAMLHGPTRDWLLAALDGPGPAKGAGHVSKANLEQIRNVVNMFAEADAQLGGGHGRQALTQYLSSTVLPLLRAETDEATRRALFDLAGEQSQLLGWMSYDVGEHGLAERYLIQALNFSKESANPILGAHTLATLSHLATTLGHSKEGVQLARTGQAALRGASHAMLADLAVLEARSLAISGDARGSARAIHRAEAALRSVVIDDEPPEMRFIDHAYVAGEIANTLVQLGDAARAIDFAQQSIDSSLAQKRARRGALSSVALAQAHLTRRELDGACAAGSQAVSLARDVDSQRTTQALRELKANLAPHTEARPARALLEQLDRAIR